MLSGGGSCEVEGCEMRHRLRQPDGCLMCHSCVGGQPLGRSCWLLRAPASVPSPASYPILHSWAYGRLLLPRGHVRVRMGNLWIC